MNYADFCFLQGLCAHDGGLGSVYKVWAIRSSQVRNDRTSTLGLISEPLELAADANVAEYTFAPDKARLKLDERDKDGTAAIRVRLTGFYPGLREKSEAEINRLRNGRYIIVAHLHNGDVMRLGSIDTPLRFKANSDSDRSTEGDPGADLEWYGEVSPCDVSFMDPAQPIPNTATIFSPIATDTMDASTRSAVTFTDNDTYQGVSINGFPAATVTRRLSLRDKVTGFTMPLVEITYPGGTSQQTLTYNWLQNIDATDVDDLEAAITANTSRALVVDWDEITKTLLGAEYYCAHPSNIKVDYSDTGIDYLALWGFSRQIDVDGYPNRLMPSLVSDKQVRYLGKNSNIVTHEIGTIIRRIKSAAHSFGTIIDVSDNDQLSVQATIRSSNCSNSYTGAQGYFTSGNNWFDLAKAEIDFGNGLGRENFPSGSLAVTVIGQPDNVYNQVLTSRRNNGLTATAGIVGQVPITDPGGGFYFIPALFCTVLPTVQGNQIQLQSEVEDYEGIFGYTVTSRFIQVRDKATGQVLQHFSLLLNQDVQTVNWTVPRPYDFARIFEVSHEVYYAELSGKAVYNTFDLMIAETY